VSTALTFDAAQHRYFLGNRELPSVTQSLKYVGLIDYSHIPGPILERAAERGKRVHLALEYFDNDSLVADSCSEEIAGHVRAYERFKADSGFVPGVIERRRHHPVIGYAGTPDRIGMIGKHPVVLDLKSGMVLDGHACQLAGYAHLFPNPRRFRRIALQTFATGKYRVHEYKPEDFDYHSQLLFGAVRQLQQEMNERNREGCQR
jgi:hypothetical protein